MKSARQICLEMLVKVEIEGAYSNIVLDETIGRSDLSSSDKRFASALFYGVIERKITLDLTISQYLKKPINKLQTEVLQILRMGVYQILYMDSVPDNAAVNESVKLAKKNKNPSISGMVNAILRNFIRSGGKIPDFDDEKKSLSVKYSAPIWLIKKWFKEFGKKETIEILENSVGAPPITAVLNTAKFELDEILKALDEAEISFEKIERLDNVIRVNGISDIRKIDAYKMGMFHIQDISSYLCCRSLDAKPSDIVLDVCSAPGGKAFTLAQQMNDDGQIFAFDLHETRVNLINQGAQRLGLSSIKACVNDGAVFDENMPLADKILCDVPCSGLGVIRRKPEIKYKDKSEFENLPEIQYSILETSAKYLKIGGELVYSTCTLNKYENEEVIEKFLQSNKNFVKQEFLTEMGQPFGEYKATILPKYFNSDGFFIAKIKRVN